MDLEGKSIIVTGAASGIGLATTVDLRNRGARVIGVDLNESSAANEHHEADLSDPDAIDRLVDQLPEGANGLCNIAGVPPSAPAEVVMALNAKGLERLTNAVAPKLAEGASIVNIASSAGSGWAGSVDVLIEFDSIAFEAAALADFASRHDLTEGGASYFFSKEFVITWTMRHRWKWRHRGIRMNCISPGPVDTPALPAFIETLGRAKRIMDLMDRPGHADEIAPVIAFLLSGESDWIRGTNIAVDGGLTSLLALEKVGLGQ